MKLLMISGDRSILRGKRSAFWYTLQELRKHWDRIDIICPHVLCNPALGCHSSVPVQDGGGEVHFHPSPHGLWYQPFWILKRGQQLISEHRYNVMTVHDYPPFYNGLGARWLAKSTKVPFAVEIHHIVGYPRAASFAEVVGRVLSRFVLPHHARKAAKVRVVNMHAKKLLVSWGVDPAKLTIVPSFYLDRDLLTKEIRPPVSYDVSFCGRLVPNKQLHELIEAVSDIPEVRLLVIGDGPERKRCQALAKKLGMGERITFLGWLPTAEDVVGAVLTARVFVMNSLSEGGPRSALEAMGMGMPVIATPVGIMPEVIEEGVNGMFTDGSRGDLRRKIMRLVENDAERERLGAEARKILDRFDRTLLIRQYADFLKSLAPLKE
ncbi:MAG: glycosyltransferase [Candidatus Peribacteraceae bacterium]|nr:glycosyltransferase [Candidatus Peribacteraceae bacterium]MDD5739320.1 glycosyltransferase [Candidatus Peribacteraceae bacterium]